ncbi:MAG TPA: AI-2E family transporter [Rhodothermales bacterium]|nr:AI-2E family transporter [Rhodothermales bacterium]
MEEPRRYLKSRKLRSRRPRPVRPERESPDLSRLGRLLHRRAEVATTAIVGLFVLAVFYTLYFGRSFFLPLFIALLLDRVLSPVIEALRRVRIPSPVGALLILIFLVAGTSAAVYFLSEPAREWMQHAPEDLRKVEDKVRALVEPVKQVQAAAQEVQRAATGAMAQGGEPASGTVKLEPPSFADTLLGQTQAFLTGAVITFLFLYFLLASGDRFLRTFVHVLPNVRDKRKAVDITHQIDRALSRYLFTVTIINICLGIAIGLAMYLFGMPNPELWGVMAALLNFIPYLGPIATGIVIAFVALVSFGTLGKALLITLVYTVIHLTESYLVSPYVLGQRLTLNPLFIFLTLIFWGWIWGIAGALLAVPLLVAFKIFCDSVDTLKPIGAFLG